MEKNTRPRASLARFRFAIKDNILFAGHSAGACSKMLEHYTASYDSTAIAALKKA